jgi:ferredoxin
MSTYVILTSKPGHFRTEPGDGLVPVEAWDYHCDGRVRARFLVAELPAPTRVRVIDDSGHGSVNPVQIPRVLRGPRIGAPRTARAVQLRQHAGRASPPGPRRLQYAMTISITFISNDNKLVSAPDNSNLLRVSLREKGGIPFKCGGGLCGTCKCRIEQGLDNTDEVKAKERKHLSDEDLAAGYRMACQTFVKGDIAVSW